LGLEPAVRLRHLDHARLGAIELELGRAGVALDDLSAVRDRRAGTPPERFDVGQLVGSSVEAWRAVAAAQNATIRFGAPPRPVWVVGERLRLAQAIGNLLANAIEHGGGAVVVELGCRRGTARIEIADAGPGLPAPIPQLIRRRAVRGRGHGLGIVSRVAAAHGGRLTAARSDVGARMVLELPATGDLSHTARL
jgi:signal transduction histidine kinase